MEPLAAAARATTIATPSNASSVGVEPEA